MPNYRMRSPRPRKGLEPYLAFELLGLDSARRLRSIPTRLVLFTVLACLKSTISSAQPATPALSEDFWQKVTIAILAAIFSFTSSYVIYRLGERRKARYQASYEIHVDRALALFKRELQHKLKMLFLGHEVQNLYQVSCRIKNTGNAVIRKEQIRFSFPRSITILDFSVLPDPEPELGLEHDSDLEFSSDRRIYLEYFAPTKQLDFSFVVNVGDGTLPELRVYHKNEKEDVSFLETSLQNLKQDEEILRRFLILSVLFLVLPGLTRWIPLRLLADLAEATVALALLLLLLPLLPSAARIIARRVLQGTERSDSPHTSVEIYGNQSTAVTVAGEGNVVSVSRDQDKEVATPLNSNEPTPHDI